MQRCQCPLAKHFAREENIFLEVPGSIDVNEMGLLIAK